MSIPVSLYDVKEEQRTSIVNDLYIPPDIKSKNKTALYTLRTDSTHVYLPFSYAKEIGFKEKSTASYPSIDIQFTGILRDYQEEMIDQVLDELDHKKSCILSLHVGWGKSVFGLYLAHVLGLKTLIIVKGVILLQQWADLIQQICPQSTYQILTPKQSKDTNAHFYLINAINIPKMSDCFDDIGTLICDEIHLLCSPIFHKSFYYIYPKYLIGLSATPYRTDDLDKIIRLYFGQHVITKKLFKPHVVNAIYTNVLIDYKTKLDGSLDWDSVLRSQCCNEQRNLFIVDLIQKHKDLNFLVLCKRIEQGEFILNRLMERGEHVTHLLGSQKEYNKEARIIVATIMKCGVGFSHEKLNALLLASDARDYYIQYLGRVFRTPDAQPIVFDIIDDLFILKKHFNDRKKVYIECGGKINTIKQQIL